MSYLELDPHEYKQEGGLRTQGKCKHTTSDRPLVSVITIVYQGQEFLENTIKSVINQSYENLEYIVIDGGSTDGTVEIIKRYEERIDYWISELDDGISDAMNKGINLASGIILNHLHAGDKFSSNQIVSQILSSYQKEKWRWCFGNQILINSSGNSIGMFCPPKFSSSLLHLVNTIPHATVFSEKSLMQEVGSFDNSYKCAMDYHLWLRFTELSKPKQFDLTVAQFLLGGRSSDVKLALQEEFRARKEVLKQSFIEKFISYFVILIRLLKRKLNITTFVKA
jgi:glycosyltransferase involved in cell wall biosynthesis